VPPLRCAGRPTRSAAAAGRGALAQPLVGWQAVPARARPPCPCPPPPRQGARTAPSGSGAVRVHVPGAGCWGPGGATGGWGPQAGVRCRRPDSEYSIGWEVRQPSHGHARSAGASRVPGRRWAVVPAVSSAACLAAPRPGGGGETPVGWRGAAGWAACSRYVVWVGAGECVGEVVVSQKGPGLPNPEEAGWSYQERGLVVGWRGPAGWHGERPGEQGVQELPGASPAPNKRLQATARSVRCAPASGRA
jgi:hypothetical protein